MAVELTYLELTAYLKGDKFYNAIQKFRMATDEELNRFCNILSCNKRYINLIDMTNNSASFFKSFNDIAELFPKEIYDDLYYSVKNRKRYDRVPSKLLYLLFKSKEEYIYPNLAISMIKRSELLQFCIEGVLLDDLTILDIIKNVWQADVLLLTGRRVKALYKNVYEVYVNKYIDKNGIIDKSFDQIALIHEKIIERAGNIDWKSIYLKEDSGLISNDTILRYLNGRCGIVKDDLDLTVID